MATLEDLEGLLEDIDGKINTLTTKVDADRDLYKACPNCNPGGITLPDFEGCTRCENGFIKVRTLANQNPGG